MRVMLRGPTRPLSLISRGNSTRAAARVADEAQLEPVEELTGAKKLLADAIREEAEEMEREAATSGTRDYLKQTQGPIWTGDESQADAVLRMLVDKHKPLRSGGIKVDASEKKAKSMLKGKDFTPRIITEEVATEEVVPPTRTTVPPHLHRPWMSSYVSPTGESSPKVRYGTFIASTSKDLSNLLELPANADAKARAKFKAQVESERKRGRIEGARDGALDYKLGIGDEAGERGRQTRGRSAAGAARGGVSGVKAWSGLVEDRFERAKEAGFFDNIKGTGKPLTRDVEESNPFLDRGEFLMNRIVQRQGALPPWIEAQQTLDATLSTFRSTLLRTYTTHIVRLVIASQALSPLPPIHTIPDSDPEWEAREFKFHAENIKEINKLLDKMNMQAPAVARRPPVLLEHELARVRGDVVKSSAWEDIKRRASEKERAATASQAVSGSGESAWNEKNLDIFAALRRVISTIFGKEK